MTHSSQSGIPDRAVIASVMGSVVQVVALKKGLLGNMSSVWTGSGTIVDGSGIILTNCHVVNPRAMGMPSPEADRLAIAITQQSDEPPAITYFAEIVVQSPELDLAVLRISSGLDGRPLTRKLNLPAVQVGDSDLLELGDQLAIFGYPGIGGETVTYTSGSVSGFGHEKGVADRRAWIKTDATIAGGNSGGTAIDHQGRLVGIPTQAAAGAGVTPVDARPVVDTNRDGRIDQRDTPMAIGGFINGLRPVNLARPLLTKAGVRSPSKNSRPAVPGAPAAPKTEAPPKSTATRKAAPAPAAPRSTKTPSRPSTAPARTPAGAQPTFSDLLFSSRITQDGRPIAPSAILASGGKELYATFEYENMQNGLTWSQVWASNGQTIVSKEGQWEDGAKGRKVLYIAHQAGIPDGEYRVVVTIGTQILVEGGVTVGRRQEDSDTQLSGQVVEEATGQGIGDALVIALKPGIRAQDFVRQQDQKMAQTHTRTDTRGHFTFPEQLPKGQAYGLVIVARGYKNLAVDGALRVSANAPETATINPIPLSRG